MGSDIMKLHVACVEDYCDEDSDVVRGTKQSASIKGNGKRERQHRTSKDKMSGRNIGRTAQTATTAAVKSSLSKSARVEVVKGRSISGTTPRSPTTSNNGNLPAELCLGRGLFSRASSYPQPVSKIDHSQGQEAVQNVEDPVSLILWEYPVPNSVEGTVQEFSPDTCDYHSLLAKFDTGTDENWISQEALDLLKLKSRDAASAKFLTFNHETFKSNKEVIIIWGGFGNSVIRETPFRVVANAPFKVVIGKNYPPNEGIFPINRGNDAFIPVNKVNKEGELGRSPLKLFGNNNL